MPAKAFHTTYADQSSRSGLERSHDVPKRLLARVHRQETVEVVRHHDIVIKRDLAEASWKIEPGRLNDLTGRCQCARTVDDLAKPADAVVGTDRDEVRRGRRVVMAHTP